MSRRKELPDLRLLEGVVSDRILNAAKAASKMLEKAGIRHALIGGLAVGAYGYVRATKDVDFLVGEEGFEEHPGGIVTFAAGVPVEVNGVAIDTLSDDMFDEDDVVDIDIPIVSPELLIYLKLKAHRQRDKNDIVELLRGGGVDEDDVREYLRAEAPDMLDRFEALAEIAEEEE